jgi:hypothetical protein
MLPGSIFGVNTIFLFETKHALAQVFRADQQVWWWVGAIGQIS